MADNRPPAAASEPITGSYRAPAFADALPELVQPGATPERLTHLEEHGFVIITDFVDSLWIPILREAGRRATEGCAPENGYHKIDSSKGYVRRSGRRTTTTRCSARMVREYRRKHGEDPPPFSF